MLGSPRPVALSIGSLVLSALIAPSPLAQEKSFETALAEYEQEREREAFRLRTRGRRQLAETRDPRALEILRGDYADAEAPREFVRSTLVAMARKEYGEPKWAPQWREWREEHDEESDVWLWRTALAVEGRSDPGAWTEVAFGRAPAPLRAAALGAGAEIGGETAPAAAWLGGMQRIVDRLPSRGMERAVLLEAVLSTFRGTKPESWTEEQTKLLLAVADRMDENRTTERTQIVLARLFAEILGCDDIGPDAEAWKEILSRPREERGRPISASMRGNLSHRFFGIHGHGRRLCYVIDASDSMLEPLTAKERAQLHPLTGADRGSGPELDPSSSLAERAIDWEEVETRFDAARELLALSIAELQPTQEFAVVLFGDEAKTLDATPKFVEAKRRQVRNALAELDAIVAGRPTEDRPHGTLRGKTNLHGALRLAFELTTRGRVDDGESHVDEKAFERGCDTVLLLSDGDPSDDDFGVNDVNEDGGIWDLETGEKIGTSETAYWPGPFVRNRFLLPDLERLALLRRPAIHAVGLGEAAYDLLEKIAAIGGGKVLRIGKESEEDEK